MIGSADATEQVTSGDEGRLEEDGGAPGFRERAAA